MKCANPDCKIILKEFEKYGGNDLCTGHRLEKITREKLVKRFEKAKFMSPKERQEFLTPQELEEFKKMWNG